MSVMSETENKQYKNFADMTKEEIEASLAIATKEAQQELHDHGLPYVIGNSEGIYEIYPNGERVFKPYKDEK